jgi:hypothetical protein
MLLSEVNHFSQERALLNNPKISEISTLSTVKAVLKYLEATYSQFIYGRQLAHVKAEY